MQKLKNYLIIGHLLLGIIIVFFSCQKENIDNLDAEHYQEKKLNTISLEELNSKIQHSKKFIGLSSYFDVNLDFKDSQSQLKLNDSSEAHILTDEISMITREDITFYTFKIQTHSDGYEFYNLVVTVDDLGEIGNLHILEYLPSDFWLQNMEQPFNGEVKMIENNIFSNDDVDIFFSKSGISDCMVGLDYAWDCGAGNNHGPGHPACTSENNAVTQLIITPIYGPCPEEIDAGDSSTGGWPIESSSPFGGGSTSTDNPDEDSFDTNPKYDKKQIKRKEKLLEMSNNQIIKSKIEELVPKVYSDTTVSNAINLKEDGARFNLIGNNQYSVREPTLRLNHGVEYTPDYANKEIVSIHIHQQRFFDNSINLNPFKNSPVFSETDISEFLDNIAYIEGTESSLTNDVTSMLISELEEGETDADATIGMMALVVNDKELAIDAHAALQNPETKDRFENDFRKKVLQNSCSHSCMRTRISKFIKRYKINGKKLGISIYIATVIEGSITSWNKL